MGFFISFISKVLKKLARFLKIKVFIKHVFDIIIIIDTIFFYSNSFTIFILFFNNFFLIFLHKKSFSIQKKIRDKFDTTSFDFFRELKKNLF